jgi:hypothetical protein
VILGNFYDITLGEWRADAHSLISAQEFWFAVGMTVLYVPFLLLCLFGDHLLMLYSILIPWVTLRKVAVEVELVSAPSGFLHEI